MDIELKTRLVSLIDEDMTSFIESAMSEELVSEKHIKELLDNESFSALDKADQLIQDIILPLSESHLELALKKCLPESGKYKIFHQSQGDYVPPFTDTVSDGSDT